MGRSRSPRAQNFPGDRAQARVGADRLASDRLVPGIEGGREILTQGEPAQYRDRRRERHREEKTDKAQKIAEGEHREDHTDRMQYHAPADELRWNDGAL